QGGAREGSPSDRSGALAGASARRGEPGRKITSVRWASYLGGGSLQPERATPGGSVALEGARVSPGERKRGPRPLLPGHDRPRGVRASTGPPVPAALPAAGPGASGGVRLSRDFFLPCAEADPLRASALRAPGDNPGMVDAYRNAIAAAEATGNTRLLACAHDN